MNLTKSVRELAANIDSAPDNYDSNDHRFNSIFRLLDKDNNGTLDEEEVFAFVKLFESEKTKNASLKKNLLAVVGISAAVILVMGVCTFGAVFVAVKATKDTQVSSSGALMNKEGSRMLSTVAQGTRFQLFNTSEDTPLCVAGETFEIIQSNVLQGSKVILDVEEEGIDKRTILSLDAATEISSSGLTCFRSSDGKEHCFADAQPGECDSFGGPEGRRQLGWWTKFKKKIGDGGKKWVADREDEKPIAEQWKDVKADAAAEAEKDKGGWSFGFKNPTEIQDGINSWNVGLNDP